MGNAPLPSLILKQGPPRACSSSKEHGMGNKRTRLLLLGRGNYPKKETQEDGRRKCLPLSLFWRRNSCPSSFEKASKTKLYIHAFLIQDLLFSFFSVNKVYFVRSSYSIEALPKGTERRKKEGRKEERRDIFSLSFEEKGNNEVCSRVGNSLLEKERIERARHWGRRSKKRRNKLMMVVVGGDMDIPSDKAFSHAEAIEKEPPFSFPNLPPPPPPILLLFVSSPSLFSFFGRVSSLKPHTAPAWTEERTHNTSHTERKEPDKQSRERETTTTIVIIIRV